MSEAALFNIAIIEAITPEQVASAKALFLDYARSLDFSLCFQGFEREMAEFPADYAPPEGALLLGLADGKPQGAVGLRPLDGGACEMKRLYVRPAARGAGMGRRLAEATIAQAKARGFAVMRLDTLPSMTEAVALYRRLGCREIAAYTHNPVPGAMFMELALR